MKTIATANQKDGAGKTATAVNLAACLAERRRRVLLELVPKGAPQTGYDVVKRHYHAHGQILATRQYDPVPAGALHQTQS